VSQKNRATDERHSSPRQPLPELGDVLQANLKDVIYLHIPSLPTGLAVRELPKVPMITAYQSLRGVLGLQSSAAINRTAKFDAVISAQDITRCRLSGGFSEMRSKDDIVRRQAEAKFALREARKAAADAHESIMARIAEQRALRLAKKTEDKPPITGKKVPG
jgi:hypothetical protein